ncbi:MAG: ThiF family adenylyltransferase [Acidobacteriota bacterium]|nr:ThiF family adenylyltransferase [Acidobacteriota bacterium]
MEKFNRMNDINADESGSTILEASLRKWKTAAGFYRERDNRTALQIENLEFYSVQPIEIWLDPLSLDSSAVQEAALLVCNLTARWARSIIVRLSVGTSLAENLRRDGFELLADRILSEMKAADPFGDFSVLDYAATGEKSESNSLRLFVGSWANVSIINPAATKDDYFIDASGWSVFGKRGSGFGKNIPGETSVPASALAASLGAADLFKRAVGHERVEWMPDNFVWNVWDQKFSDTEFAVSIARAQGKNKYPVYRDSDIGRTLLAGVGAIGSALVYLLDFMRLSGELVFLDRDRVETSNLNRSPLFNVLHALESWEKTQTATNYLSRHRITLSGINGTWQENAAQVASQRFDQWISLTNEDGAWALVPFLLPPVVLHGTTTSGWGFGAGRHIPRVEDCTLCRMPRPEIKFRAICAQGEISNRDENTQTVNATASLPFLSTASAALLLAEMIKLSISLTHPHFAEMVVKEGNEIAADLRFGLFAITPLKRLINESCRGCSASTVDKWFELGGRSRYRTLSETQTKQDLELRAA